MKGRYIKDHISTHGKDIKRATNEKFGVNNSLIIKAAMGDEKALKQIGDMGKTGERLQLAMPMIKEKLKVYIAGTTEYNKALAEIYKDGGKGASTIAQAGMATALENVRYNHLMEEYLEQYNRNLSKENQRHADKLDIIELTAWVDSMMVDVEVRATMDSLTTRPYEAQLKADEDYEAKKITHLLEHGSESNLSLIPRKHFSNNIAAKMVNWVKELFS